MRLAWTLVIVGAVMTLGPGMLDPLNMTVNGLTLLGITTMVFGAIRAALTV
jgi:hypothetical protein